MKDNSMKKVTAKVLTTFTQDVEVEVNDNASEHDIKMALIDSSSITANNTNFETDVYDIEVVA